MDFQFMKKTVTYSSGASVILFIMGLIFYSLFFLTYNDNYIPGALLTCWIALGFFASSFATLLFAFVNLAFFVFENLKY